jgi:hypothetical protein
MHLVLVVDDATGSLGRVAWLLLQAGFDTLHGALPDEAWLLARQESKRIGLLVLPATADPAAIGRIVSELPKAVRTLVVGPQPSEAARDALRAAGVQRAVWEPWDESTLTYVVREMLGAPREGSARKAVRVPVHFEAVVTAKSAQGGAQVTALSEGGAFLETELACAEGEEIDLEFWLPDGPVAARAAVRSVRGADDADSGAPGLGVAFTRLAHAEAERLVSFVRDRAELLAMADPG